MKVHKTTTHAHLSENVQDESLQSGAVNSQTHERPFSEKPHRGLSLAFQHVHQVITQPLAIILKHTRVLYMSLLLVMKKRSERRKHCALAVVRRS